MCYDEKFLKRWTTKRVGERAGHTDQTIERPAPSAQPDRKSPDSERPRRPESEKPRTPERELETV
jgi:hypothetical protein